MYQNIKAIVETKNCPPEQGLAMFDILNIFTGKWRMIILSVLMTENLRFSEIQNVIPNITPRMLSKELKELELNGLVRRKVFDSTPVLIQYGLTDSAKGLESVLLDLVQWAVEHRKSIIDKKLLL